MARLITIEVSGQDQNYQAMVSRISESNRRMTRDATAGAQQTASAVRVWETSLSGIPGILRTIGSGFLALQAINFVKTFTGFAEVLHDTSNRTGILVEDLHALERIGKLEGVTFEQLTTSMKFLSKAIAESGDPASDAAKIFKILGINAQEILRTGGSTKDVMLQMADAFKKTLSPTDQVLVAQKMMSRGGESMIGVLKLGTGELRSQMDAQKGLGVITTDTAAKAAAARDQWGQFVSVLQARVGGPMVEFLTDMIARLQEAGPWIVWFSERVQKGAEILDGWRTALERAGDATRNWATGASQSVAELSRQLEHLQRFAPGDIASQNRLKGLIDQKTQGALVDIERDGNVAGALSTTLTPRSNQSNVAAQLAAMEKKASAAKSALADAKRLAEEEERIRQRSVEQLAKVQEEILKLEASNAALGKSQDAANEAQRAAALALIEHERAASITAAIHDKTLTPALNTAIGRLAELKVAALDAAAALRAQKEASFLDDKNAELQAMVRQEQLDIDAGRIRDNEQLKRQAVELLEIERSIGDAYADQLSARGQTVMADKARLENQIKYLEALRKEEEIRGNIEKANLHSEQIKVAQEQITSLGEVSINVGHEISRSVTDIFTAMVQGTLKASDIGKSALAALARSTGEFLSGILNKKLGFENIVFSNLRGFGGQAQNALQSGLPGGGGGAGGGGGGGGFLNMLFGGGGGATAGGNWASGFDAYDAGGFGTATAGGGSGFGGILGSVGGFLSSMGNGTSMFGAAGAPILGGAFGLMMAGFQGGFSKSKIGSTIGSTVGGAIGSIWGPIGTLIGSTIGNLVGSLFNSTPNPTAILKAQFSGIFFDALEGVFKPGTVSVSKIRSQDIGKGQVGQIKTQVQQALETASQQWTDILNLFPKVAQERMIPTLEGTNANLNNAFGRLKFSEGGKRSIEQELADFQGRESARGFFHAMRGTIGTGFQATLEQLGLPDVGQLAFEQFNRGTLHRGGRAEGGVFQFPDQSNESAAAALKAIADAAGLTAGLANVSPRGVQPFLTAADNEFLRRELTTLFTGSSGDAFTKNATALKEKLKPVTDFLQQAVGESTTIFGRGLVAALDAATQSDAKAAFMQSLGDGTKEIIFKGITEAFLASAQFNDLLAPIQQTIRGFTQEAIATGQTPDLAAFRAALLPQIEALSARGEALAPLLAELQKLGLTFNDALKAFVSKPTQKGPTTIKIDIFAGNKDVKELANELDDHLRSLLGPS